MAFTLALAQCTHPADGDVVSLVRRYAQRAACAGAQLLVFPESLMTRYENDLDAFQAKAEPLDGPFSAAVDAIAAEYGLWMVCTVHERNDDFDLMEEGLSVEEAMQEASRCLRCDHFGYGAFREGRKVQW